MNRIKAIFLMIWSATMVYASPIHNLLERIDKGASKKFIIEETHCSPNEDFFELKQKGQKVVISGNNAISIATGINWYLKYYAGIHLSWNNMKVNLPDVLPPVTHTERHTTQQVERYYLNYCTYSYSMAFWDWERWEREIDWMALHGINLPLAMVGMEEVWYRVLQKLGYSEAEIGEFIAGPGFQAWWLMNNLEGWGGPCPKSWYKDRADLQKKILKRMRELGIKPVLPGYSGMLPHDAHKHLGFNVSDPGTWCGYRRPAFLQPTDPNFERIAKLYYQELTNLYGKADYYSMDPFHEGGNVAGVDLNAAGIAIWKAMKQVNNKAVWIAQAWQANPRTQLIGGIPKGDLIVLDLFSESQPQWGDPNSGWKRKNGFDGHNWLFCMLLNYGGNVGLHGKMETVIKKFYQAKDSRFGATLRGVGLTMEGIENNPVMYELMSELPWRSTAFTKEQWLENYVTARYGKSDERVMKAWTILSNSIYNCPENSTQQGTHESIFCARPSLKTYQTSSWSEMKDYYNPQDVIRAAELMVEVAQEFKGNNNFEYDLVDIVRQAVAEKGRLIYPIIVSSYKAGEKELFHQATERFVQLIDMQDKLLATRSEFKVGTWLNAARKLGHTTEEKDLYEWNARVQITTWGNRTAANAGGLRDYAHREWSGLLSDFYKMRWTTYFNILSQRLNGKHMEDLDYYAIEEPWTLKHNPYSSAAEGDVVEVATEVFHNL